jgi:hypothetical protein
MFETHAESVPKAAAGVAGATQRTSLDQAPSALGLASVEVTGKDAASLSEYFLILHEWSLRENRPLRGLTAVETANEGTSSSDTAATKRP